MKKIKLTLLVLFLTQKLFAYWYYQPYPIAAQVNSAGGQWQVSCSVYDSLLGSTQTFNGPNCSSALFLQNDSIGLVSYRTDNVVTPNNNYRGVITYDMELHQFKIMADSCIGCHDSLFNSYIGDGISVLEKKSSGNSYSEFKVSYYDIKVSNWVSFTYAKNDPMIYSIGYGQVGCSEISPTGEYDGYFMDPKTHTWINHLSGISDCMIPYVLVSNDLAFQYNPFVCTDGIFSRVGPDGGSQVSYIDGDMLKYTDCFVACRDLMFLPELVISAYDPLSVSPSISYPDVAEYCIYEVSNSAFAITDSFNTVLHYGIYDFSKHMWVTGDDYMTSSYVSTLSVVNETINVTLDDGTNYVLGYDTLNGWSNNPTPVQPMFYVGDYSSATEGHLIYVKDYTIGSDSTFFDYGDGITTTKKSEYHLYKNNGHYRSASSLANHTICLTAATASSGSQTACQTISTTTSVKELENALDNPVQINLPKGATMLEIKNKNADDLLVNIINTAGQIVYSANSNSQQNYISVKGFASGIYIVSVANKHNNQLTTGKILVQ